MRSQAKSAIVMNGWAGGVGVRHANDAAEDNQGNTEEAERQP
jgi:hypothetical protein